MLPEKLTLSITQEHIDNGVCDNAQECAIAISFLEQMNSSCEKITDLETTHDGIHFYYDVINMRYEPVGKSIDLMDKFITDFDTQSPVDPITLNFELKY